jgi:hypothetical protein
VPFDATALLLAAALACPATQAQGMPSEPVKLHGVIYAPSLQSRAGRELNGAGTRYKAVFKVYTAGLYLEKPARSLQEIAALPGPSASA